MNKIMLGFDWVERGHKTGLKTILDNPIVCYFFFGHLWVYSALFLLACYLQ